MGVLNLCARCGEDFGSMRAFDKHQQWDKSKGEWELTCLDPAVIGLHKDSRGHWRLPGGYPFGRKDDTPS